MISWLVHVEFNDLGEEGSLTGCTLWDSISGAGNTPANEAPATALPAGKRPVLVVSLHLVAPTCKKAPAPGLRQGFEAGVEYAGCEMWGTEFQAPKHYPGLGSNC